MSNIPEPWASAIVTAGYRDPRYHDPRPSLGALAEAAGIHTTTVSRMVRGVGAAKTENVAAVAAALGVDARKVSGWVREAREESEPYVFPAEVDLLTRREREALSELIRAVTESRRAGDGNSAASTRAGVSPAPGDPAEGVSFESPDESPEGGASGRGRRARGRGGPA